MAKIQELNSANDISLKIIRGGCHCGAVQFEALMDPQSTLVNCNCSICYMTGFQHLFIKHNNFKLLTGKSLLTSYRFNTEQANHLFCSQCGVKSFYQPRSHPDCWSINTHCLYEFNADKFQIKLFNGQDWEANQDTLTEN